MMMMVDLMTTTIFIPRHVYVNECRVGTARRGERNEIENVYPPSSVNPLEYYILSLSPFPQLSPPATM